MQTPTPRISLQKMNSDGSDILDLSTQVNPNWDKIDQTFVPIDITGTARPNSAVGIMAYDDNTESHLMSVGTNEWTTFGNFAHNYQIALGGGSVPSGSLFLNIGSASQNSRVFEMVDTQTVTLRRDGLYLIEATIRFIGAAGRSGKYALGFDTRTLGGSFIDNYEQDILMDGGAQPITINLQSLYEISSGSPENIKLYAYQNSGFSRTLENITGWSSFKMTYIRPLVQGV